MKIIFETIGQEDHKRLDVVRRDDKSRILKATDLPKRVDGELIPPEDFGIIFREVDINFIGGKTGPSHHIYLEAGTLKIDGRVLEEGIEIDGVRLTLESKGRRL